MEIYETLEALKKKSTCWIKICGEKLPSLQEKRKIPVGFLQALYKRPVCPSYEMDLIEYGKRIMRPCAGLRTEAGEFTTPQL